MNRQPEFDLVGVGLNATDTLLVVAHFPAYAGKVPFEAEILSPGGQVASALVTAAKLGLEVVHPWLFAQVSALYHLCDLTRYGGC